MTARQRFEDLVLYASGDAEPALVERIEERLAQSPADREALAEIRQVSRLLDVDRAPSVSVDLARLRKEVAASRPAASPRPMRFGRLLIAGACAAVVALALTARLRIEIAADQVVLRWGAQPVPAKTAAPASRRIASDDSIQAAIDVAEQLALLHQLVDALATDVADNERRLSRSFAELRADLRQTRVRDYRRWADAKRDVDALYASRFLIPTEGETR